MKRSQSSQEPIVRPAIATAAAATLCVACITVVIISLHGYNSIALFSDYDEPSYLRHTWEQCRGPLPFHVYGSIDGSKSILAGIPHGAMDYVLGCALSVFEFSPAALGAVLDIICTFLGSLTWFALYRHFFRSNSAASVATVTTLFFPWLSGEIYALDALAPHYEGWFVFPNRGFMTEPILRAVHTQISFVLFPLALLVGLKALGFIVDDQPSSRSTLLAGMIVGGMLYVYCFAWASLVGVLGFVFIVSLLAFSGIGRTHWRDSLRFLCVALSVSIPGLLMMFLRSPGARLNLPEDVSPPFFWSPTQILLVFILLLLFTLCDTVGRRALVLILACIFVDAVGMQMQSISRRVVTPYHLGTFFLIPLTSGLVMGMSLQAFSDPRMRRTTATMVCAILMLAFALHKIRVAANHRLGSFTALAFDLNHHSKHYDRVIISPYRSGEQSLRVGTSSFHWNLIAVQSLTGVSIQPLSSAYDFDTLPTNLLLLGVIYRGRAIPILTCYNAYELAQLPNDYAYGIGAYMRNVYDEACHRAASLAEEGCRLIGELPVNTLVGWDEQWHGPLPPWLRSKPVGIDPSDRPADFESTIKLIPLDRDRLQKELGCFSSAEIPNVLGR